MKETGGALIGVVVEVVVVVVVGKDCGDGSALTSRGRPFMKGGHALVSWKVLVSILSPKNAAASATWYTLGSKPIGSSRSRWYFFIRNTTRRK